MQSLEARLQQVIVGAAFRHPRKLSVVLSELLRICKAQGIATRFSVEVLYADFRCLEVLGQSEALLEELTQATELARSNGWSPELSMLLCAIGRIHYTQGDYREAAAQLGQAIDISKLCGARATEVEARIGLGQVYDALGDGRTAARLHADAGVLAEQTQDAYLISKVALNQGFNHRIIGDPTGAGLHFQRALQAATLGKVRHYIAESHWQLAALYLDLDLGDLAHAQLHTTPWPWTGRNRLATAGSSAAQPVRRPISCANRGTFKTLPTLMKRRFSLRFNPGPDGIRQTATRPCRS